MVLLVILVLACPCHFPRLWESPARTNVSVIGEVALLVDMTSLGTETSSRTEGPVARTECPLAAEGPGLGAERPRHAGISPGTEELWLVESPT